MVHQILKSRATFLFVLLASFFVANALIAECIGGKLFSLEKVFGLLEWSEHKELIDDFEKSKFDISLNL